MVDVTDLDTYPVWYSFCIAMLMGVTHVVLGPDHVSALVLLVAVLRDMNKFVIPLINGSFVKSLRCRVLDGDLDTQ